MNTVKAVTDVSSSLLAIQHELKSIKQIQQRYEEEHIQQKAVSAAVSGAAGDDEVARGLQLQEMGEAIQKLESMISKLDQDLHSTERKMDDLEQYGRRNCLILHGVQTFEIKKASYPVFEKFVINLLNTKLNLDFKITPGDIDICHILPSRRRDTNPIIIKFVRRSVRQAVYFKKKNLKSTGNNPQKLALTESLTKRRFQLLAEARVAFGFKNVWTLNGNVFCSYKDNRFSIFDFCDINKIYNIDMSNLR